MGNKEEDLYGKHGRPCFYCFKQKDFYWMIPISSQIEKYKKLYDEKMDFLIKEAVRLELERQKIVGLELETVDESKMVNVYA